MFDRSRIKFDEVVWHDQPFVHPQSGSAAPRDFYDRSSENAALLEQLVDETTRVVAILGERRSGKTSVIRHLGAVLADPMRGIGFVEIPWGGVLTWEELAREILQAIRGTIGRLPGLEPESGDAPAAMPMLPREICHAVHELMAGMPNRRLVLAIDEFDSILFGAQDADSIVALASALVRDQSLDVCLLLTMARIPDRLLGTCLALPTSRAITLRPFAKPDMDQMILDFAGDDQAVSGSDLQAIYDFSGGWPYYAKLLLASMAGLRPGSDQVSLALAAAVDNESAAHRIANIYDVHFDDEAKKLVLLLAERGGYLKPSEVALLGSPIQGAARRLIERDYVQMAADGGVRFRIGFLGPWLCNWVRYDLEVDRRISDLLPRLTQPYYLKDQHITHP